MNPTNQTITAQFSTVDMAEFAARKVRQNFPDIHSIAIRYRNNPAPEPDLPDLDAPSATVLTAAAMGNGFVNTSGLSPVLFANALDLPADGSRYQQEDSALGSTESRLVIKASNLQIQKVEALLRNAGGLSVHHTDSFQ